MFLTENEETHFFPYSASELQEPFKIGFCWELNGGLYGPWSDPAYVLNDDHSG